mmetsp:Transcript_8843/g.54409  ORF Transcript_8843/g.54409 Transcript_8843/m.54409 type:complete len:107 (-) Transcript_8843:1747-2067(-)
MQFQACKTASDFYTTLGETNQCLELIYCWTVASANNAQDTTLEAYSTTGKTGIRHSIVKLHGRECSHTMLLSSDIVDMGAADFTGTRDSSSNNRRERFLCRDHKHP